MVNSYTPDTNPFFDKGSANNMNVGSCHRKIRSEKNHPSKEYNNKLKSHLGNLTE